MPSSLWAPLPLNRPGGRALQHRLSLDHGFSHRQDFFAQALRFRTSLALSHEPCARPSPSDLPA
jgi:hypothetical protein